jgi:hypothetical protein
VIAAVRTRWAAAEALDVAEIVSAADLIVTAAADALLVAAAVIAAASMRTTVAVALL